MTNSFAQVVEIYKGLVGTDHYETALDALDRDIDLCGVWNIAHQCNALDEHRSCEDFSHDHMMAFNQAFYNKY